MTGVPHATVSFSLLRIIFGISMLIVLIPSFADRQYLWGVGSRWIDPEARRRGWFEPLRMVFSKDSALWFDVAYFVLIALVLVFIIGFKTRWVTPVLLVFWVGLSTNSTLLTNGGDVLMRIVLLFAVFANLSQHFSVDAWLRRRAEARGVVRARRFEWISPWMHNTVLILCCYQILLVYLVSSILKLQGDEWLQGSALYYSLVIEEFRIFPALSDTVWQSTPLVMLGTWLALGVQLLFPVALLWKPSRYVAVVLITGIHLGIAVLLGLWPFSLAMIALDLLLIRDGSWTHAWGLVRRTVTARARKAGTRPALSRVG
ncbi:HTTM domain-containing protein [Microbacterium sp. P06]|uniref:HTTM domain-containing protein n=1 Tax=unclassified Microbacterium TaxID=2609290 RepID=UPI003746E9DD